MCVTWQVLKLLNALLLIHIYDFFYHLWSIHSKAVTGSGCLLLL